MSMARFSKRLFCEFVYFVFVSSFLLWLAATLQAGSGGIYLFIVNDIATDPQGLDPIVDALQGGHANGIEMGLILATSSSAFAQWGIASQGSDSRKILPST